MKARLGVALGALLVAAVAGCSGSAPAAKKPAARRAAPAPAPAPAPDEAELEAAPADPVHALLDQRLRPMLRARPESGVVVGVVRESRARVYGYGRVGPQTGDVPGGDTVYEIGSLSQVLTAVLLADAVVRGEVKLEDPVARHLPRGSVVPRHDKAPDAPIRLVHLATHTSGLPAVPMYTRKSPLASTSRLLRFVRKQKLARPPGSAYQESLLGVALLGLALEKGTDKDYESLLLERVLLPLGMGSTRTEPSASMAPRLARGHDADGKAVSAQRQSAPLLACCALRSTVHDLLRLVAAYLRSDSQLSAAMDATRVVRAQHGAGGPGGDDVGLGWMLDADGVLWQRGQRPGFDGFVAVHRERGVGVVILASSEGWDLAALGRDVLARLAAEQAPAVAAR
ncbi:MAG TPA: serine hydrolase domain-containing protein [Haliangium sp.]|nr:serine hydrolase domain-containing protein [Haliangium sp.]